jgi:hypothetical protein
MSDDDFFLTEAEVQIVRCRFVAGNRVRDREGDTGTVVRLEAVAGSRRGPRVIVGGDAATTEWSYWPDELEDA